MDNANQNVFRGEDREISKSSNTLIEVKHLFFAYEEKMVLKDINLSIEHGERIAVMGSNGAGKSTFFSI